MKKHQLLGLSKTSMLLTYFLWTLSNSVAIGQLSWENQTTKSETFEAIEFPIEEYSVGGLLVQKDGVTPVADVTVNLSGDVINSQQSSGSYLFQNIPNGSDISITPEKDINPLECVTTHDILLIRKHILGITPFTDPYSLIAADVNSSGGVSTFDLVLISDLILGNSSNFPGTPSWRFIESAYNFPVPINPWFEVFPESIEITNLQSDITSADFTGVKIGDASMCMETLNPAFLTVSASNETIISGNNVSVSIKVNGFVDVTTLQFSINWDPTKLIYASNGNYGLLGMSTASFGELNAVNGVLNFSWYDPNVAGQTLADGSVIFTVLFTATHCGSTPIQVTGNPVPMEVSDKNSLVYELNVLNGSVDASCCELMVTCPANTFLGTFDCNTVNTLASLPTNQSEAEAAPYNMTIGNTPCGTIEILSHDNFTVYNFCATGGQTVTRTVTVFDDLNGNGVLDTGEESKVCTFTFDILEDKTPPAITCPSDITIDCDEDSSPNNTGYVLATDLCSGPYVTYIEVVSSNGCPLNSIITRSWTATDDCGNVSTCDQIIEIEDITPPVMDGLADLTVECNAVPLVGTPTTTDCDPNPTVNYLGETNIPVCAGTYTLIRTWEAIDACGNNSQFSQIINVEDTTPPDITFCPSDITIECDEDTSPSNTGEVTAIDFCSGPNVTYDDVVSNTGCPTNSTIIRTWTVTDDCGNITSCNHIIEIKDVTPPNMMCGAITVMPNADGTYTLSNADFENLSSGSFDNCGELYLVATPVSFNCADEGANTVVFTGTDDCGNSNSCNATVTVAPYLTILSCTATPESCAGVGDGTISISATALGGQIKYSIDGGTNFYASGDFNNLSPATYNIVVKVFGIAEICEKTDTKTVGAGIPATTWYKDGDGDGHSNGVAIISCSPPTGYIANPITTDDCNDFNASIYPDAPELCDGLDNDCDGVIPANESDTDSDGYRICEGDCDDSDASINPGATEVCNGIDDDCDGDIDEGVGTGLTYTGNVTFTSQADVDAWQACYSIIDGNLTIAGYDITDLGPLANLEEVTGSVSIYYNYVLSSIDGLENLNTVAGNLTMFYNFLLSDCCAIHDLINGGVTGTITIFFNAAGCNSVGEINSNCGGGNMAEGPNSFELEGVSFEDNGQNTKGYGLIVYPNPASDAITVLLQKPNKHGFLVVTDVFGKKIWTSEMNTGTSKIHIDLSNPIFTNGVYSVSLIENGERFTQQFILHR